MSYVLGEPTVQQYFDANGDPLALGTIEFYVTNTSTPTPIYSDSSGTAIGTSVTLNSLGAPANSGTAVALFFDSDVTYKIVRKDASGVEIDPTIDPYLVVPAPANPSSADYGLTGDGSADDTVALQAFFTACADKYGFVADSSQVFRITEAVTIPDGAVIDANGATISIQYSSVSTVCISGGEDVLLSNMNIVVPTSFTVDRTLNLGARSKGSNIKVTSTDQQNNRNATNDAAVRIVGNEGKLSGIHIENFDNGVASNGYNNVDMDHIYIKNYVRGLYMNDGDYCTLSHYICEGLSANGLPDPGHNGVLLSDMRFSSFDNLGIHDAGEHGIRVGGSTEVSKLTFSGIQVHKPGQCGMKLFGGVRFEDIAVNGLLVTDCSSGGASGSNEDGFRAQLVDHLMLTGYTCTKRDNTGTGTYDGIYLENCTYVSVVSPSLFFVKNHGIHITDGGVAANVSNIYITSPQIFNTTDGDAVQIDVATTSSTLKDVVITDLYSRQANNYVVEIDSTDTIITGPVIVTGYAVAGGVGTLSEVTAISDTLYVTDITVVS